MNERKGAFDIDHSADQPGDDVPGVTGPNSRGIFPRSVSEPEASLNRIGTRIDSANAQIGSIGRSLAALMLQQPRARETPAISAIATGARPASPMSATIGAMRDVSLSEQIIASGKDPLGELTNPGAWSAPDSSRAVDGEVDPGGQGGDTSSGSGPTQSSGLPLAGRPVANSMEIDPGSSMTSILGLPTPSPGRVADLYAEGQQLLARDDDSTRSAPRASLPAPGDGPPNLSGGPSFLARLANLESERPLMDRSGVPGAATIPATTAILGAVNGPASDVSETQGPGLEKTTHSEVGSALFEGFPAESGDVMARRDPLASVPGTLPRGIFGLGLSGPLPGSIVPAGPLGDDIHDDSPINHADSLSQPFAATRMDASGRGDSQVDLSRTNQLLQQLIEEVRKGRQGFSSGGARQVEPAR